MGGSGIARRALVALGCGAALTAAGAAQRLRILPLPVDRGVTWRPRLAIHVPAGDERITLGGAVVGGAGDDVLSPEEQAQLDDRAAAALGQHYRPRPAIWRVGDRDTTIYLFGTIHVLPPGFRWRSPALDRVVARAGLLLVESPGDPAALLTGTDAPATALPPLAQRVSPSHRARLRRFADGLPPQAAAVLDTLPTWTAAVAVSYVRELRAGATPGAGADDWLEARFRAAGKPVEPIEDGARVIAGVNAVPAAEQRRMLDAALDAPDPNAARLRAPLHGWARGQVGPRSALARDLAATGGAAALDRPLLAERNRAWADALVLRLRAPGTMLFAAGAGHFIGRGSVLAQLRARGMKVVRVE